MFYDKYKKMCEDINKTPSAVAQEIGINKSTVTTWKRTGRTPKMPILTLISDYFGIPVSSLIDDEPDEEANIHLTVEESYLIETYRSLPEPSRKWVMQSLEMAKTSALGKNNLDSSMEAV